MSTSQKYVEVSEKPLVNESELADAKSQLKHAKVIKDHSAPVIEKNVHIQKNHHNDLLSEIHQPHELQHTETKDKSAPVI